MSRSTRANIHLGRTNDIQKKNQIKRKTKTSNLNNQFKKQKDRLKFS